jgi:hypothetical protein
MMNLKVITFTVLVSTFALGCNSDVKNEDTDHNTHASDSSKNNAGNLNKMRTGTGPGTGTGSASGSGTGTPGTGTGPGINSEAGSETGSRPKDIPNGTGTEPKKIDTGVKRGKWPTQGDPYN